MVIPDFSSEVKTTMFRNFKIAACAGLLGLSSSTLLAGAVVPISPGDANKSSVITDDCPTFSWSRSVGAEGYELAIFEAFGDNSESYEQMAYIIDPVITRTLSAPAFSWTPSSESCLNQGASYIWYVRDLIEAGQSDWSNGKLFTVDLMAAASTLRDSIDPMGSSYEAEQLYWAINPFGPLPWPL